ncbi:hypothetical protein [uncultured Phocaeicola sp.]|uniref:hypothetical protein n=1 Tax=uncultured Phocaeicola sp. TaxID=990718 RepID=UPI0032208753
MIETKNEIIKDYIKSQGYNNIVSNGFTIAGYKGSTRLSVDKLSDDKVSISKTIISDYDELIKAIEMTVPLQVTDRKAYKGM